MDLKHPTNQFFILFLLPLFIMALIMVLVLWLSGDIYLLNCEINCFSLSTRINISVNNTVFNVYSLTYGVRMS